MEGIKFDYYYGYEAEQFSFFRIPKALIKDERFRKLSNDAKLLYGLMLDRMALSIKNGWVDVENRAYIHYTVANIMEDLGCAKATCTKIMAELDSKKGIGLIERKRQGQGKPDIIYVKNFTSAGQTGRKDVEKTPNEPEGHGLDIKEQERACAAWDTWKEEEPTWAGERPRTPEAHESVAAADVQNLGFRGNPANDFMDNPVGATADACMETQIPKNLEARNPESKFQESQNLDWNNTNNNKTDFNKTYPIHPINHINPISPPIPAEDCHRHVAGDRETIRRNIDLDSLAQTEGADRELYEELYGIICDTVCMPRKTVRIAGEDYPYGMVRERFLGLGREHLIYIVRCMQNMTSKVYNIKAYLTTALYNAPLTLRHYYQQEVQHDLYGLGAASPG